MIEYFNENHKYKNDSTLPVTKKKIPDIALQREMDYQTPGCNTKDDEVEDHS